MPAPPAAQIGIPYGRPIQRRGSCPISRSLCEKWGTLSADQRRLEAAQVCGCWQARTSAERNLAVEIESNDELSPSPITARHKAAVLSRKDTTACGKQRLVGMLPNREESARSCTELLNHSRGSGARMQPTACPEPAEGAQAVGR